MAIDFPISPTNGQIYTDTTSGMTWVYSTTDTAWSASFNRSNYVNQTFTATAGQTSFTVSGGYLPSLVDVYQNGVLLVNGTDVTVASGTVVVLAVGATAGDIVQVHGNQAFNYAATVPASKGGTGLTSVGAAGNVLTSDGTNWTSAALSTTPVGGLLSLSINANTATATTSGTGSVATITFTPNYTIPVGSQVYISGVTPTGYNGLWTVTASSAGSISFACTATGSQTVAGALYPNPSGYLPCDGSVYLKSAYPALAAYIGSPIIASNPVVKYTNNSLIVTGTYWGELNFSMQTNVTAVNSYLVTSGTVLQKASSASGAANALLYSTDGITWTSATTAFTPMVMNRYADTVVYGNSIYVGGLDSGNTTAAVQYSSTLTGTWTKAVVGTAGTGAAIQELAFGGTGNVFIAQKVWDNCGLVVEGIFYSTNGSTWTSIGTVTGLTNQFTSNIAAYSGGAVIGVQYGSNNLWYSASGTTGWTNIWSSVGSPTAMYNVSYTNSRFIVRCSTGIWTSTTGASGTWTQVTNSTAYIGGYSSKLRWNGTVYIDAFGGYYTTDLINWGYNTGTCPVTAVLSTATFSKVYDASLNTKYVRGYDFNVYNSSTQFPVPVTNLSSSGSALYLNGGAGQSTKTFIKT